MKIAIWAEHTRGHGRLCNDQDLIDSESNDVVVFDMTREELSAIAKAYHENYERMGGAGSIYYLRASNAIREALQ